MEACHLTSREDISSVLMAGQQQLSLFDSIRGVLH